MKKIGKIRKTGLAFTALSVSAALLGGGLVCAMPYSVSADNVPSARAATETSVFENLSVPTEVDYGDDIKVPAAGAVAILAPDVTEVKPQSATDNVYSVKANQVGNYTVKYYDGSDENAAYSFNINVSLKEDFFLKVDNNGAGIPTRIKKGESFKLPSAHVAYYDENKILHYYPGDVEWSITDSLGGKYENFGDDVEAKNNGKLYVTYSAQLDNGKKFFNETFTVNVQSTLSDKQAPSLTVSGITSSVSVRRAVLLPTATVSDDYDENPLVEITVTDPNGNPVKIVDIDQYGYAYQDADKLAEDEQYLQTDAGDIKLNYPAVAFDNKDVMTFYPLIAGQYKV
ncbi:MAG: hypothetical protein K2M48_06810, partial [Clostridiales bacterium]|nr:hypothetical protein [Clostridiales bacterium]